MCVLSCVLSGGRPDILLARGSGRPALVYLSSVLVHILLLPYRHLTYGLLVPGVAGSVAQTVSRKLPTAEVPNSRLGQSWWTKLCWVDFLGIYSLFPCQKFIPQFSTRPTHSFRSSQRIPRPGPMSDMSWGTPGGVSPILDRINNKQKYVGNIWLIA